MKTLSIRGGLRSNSALAFGSLANGVLAYAFFAITTRALGAEAAAPVVVLLAWWAFAAAAFTFPVQHWIARSVTLHGGEAAVRAAMPNVARLVAMVSVLVGVLAWAMQDLLFHGEGAAFALLAAGVTAGSALTGYVRGVLTGRKRLGAAAVAMTAENAARCFLAIVLLAGGQQDAVWFGLALLLGFSASLAWPSVLWLPAEVNGLDDDAGPVDSTLAFLSGAASGQLIAHVMLTGGPLVLTLAGGGPREVTALFAGLTLFRVPYILAIGVVSPLTGRVRGMLVAEDWDGLEHTRWLLQMSAGFGAAMALPVGWWAGPPLLRLIFGADVLLGGFDSTVIALGSAIALANLVATVILLAQDRPLVLLAIWSLALIPGVATFILRSGSDPLTTTCLAFLFVEASALAGLMWDEWRGAAQLRREADPGDWATPEEDK